MELDVKFSLYMEPNFTSRYLTSIINHPVIITAYDATNAKSATKGMYRIRRAAESKSIPHNPPTEILQKVMRSHKNTSPR
jgi:hypothetical protein